MIRIFRLLLATALLGCTVTCVSAVLCVTGPATIAASTALGLGLGALGVSLWAQRHSMALTRATARHLSFWRLVSVPGIRDEPLVALTLLTMLYAAVHATLTLLPWLLYSTGSIGVSLAWAATAVCAAAAHLAFRQHDALVRVIGGDRA